MQYNILFCTLAVGKEYNGYAQRLYHTLQKVLGCPLLIVTDNIEYFKNTPKNNLILRELTKNYKTEINWANNYAPFNYNLKFLPIKFARKDSKENKKFDFIFFVDCDWFLRQSHSKHKFNLELQGLGEYDALAGRDLRLFHEKQNRQLIPIQKLELYNLYNTTKYDQAQIVNEQYLLFRNSDKLDVFIESWEKLEKICSDNNGIAYAEGLEIGMSAIDANIKFKISNIVGDLFWFYSNKQLTYFGA
jgi:hypothetical protein